MGAPKGRLQASSGIWSALVAACVLSPAAFADCALPAAPSKIPDGTRSTDTEMRAAMQIVKRYDADVTTYVKCLDFHVKLGRLSATEAARLQNAALERLERTADLFNEQMRIFLGH